MLQGKCKVCQTLKSQIVSKKVMELVDRGKQDEADEMQKRREGDDEKSSYETQN